MVIADGDTDPNFFAASAARVVAVLRQLEPPPIAPGDAPRADCRSLDRNGNGQVSIDELLQAVNGALALP